MTPAEVSQLLALVAGFDRRTTGRSEDIAWTAAAQVGGWTVELAQRAVVEHYATSTEWLMPAHITARVSEVRRRVHEMFTLPAHPPELADDGPAFVAWARRAKARHMATGLAEWACSGHLPTPRELET